jgi:hypothetical protein
LALLIAVPTAANATPVTLTMTGPVTSISGDTSLLPSSVAVGNSAKFAVTLDSGVSGMFLSGDSGTPPSDMSYYSYQLAIYDDPSGSGVFSAGTFNFVAANGANEELDQWHSYWGSNDYFNYTADRTQIGLGYSVLVTGGVTLPSGTLPDLSFRSSPFDSWIFGSFVYEVIGPPNENGISNVVAQINCTPDTFSIASGASVPDVSPAGGLLGIAIAVLAMIKRRIQG